MKQNQMINTNISSIPKTKSLYFDISSLNYNESNKRKNYQKSSHLNLNQKNFINIIPQSPKLSNYKFRSKSQPHLFSISDINERYHSKAPSLPNQYKRKIYNNINYLLYDKNKKGLIFKIPQIEYEYNNKTKREDDAKKKRVSTVSRKERLYKPKCWDMIDNNEIKKGQRDKLMPEGFQFYEKIVINNNENYVKDNYTKINFKLNKKLNIDNNIDNNNKILIRKLYKLNEYKSNIFFTNKEKVKDNDDKKKELFLDKKKKLYKKYSDNDIFNLRKEKNNIEKNGEYNFLKHQKNNVRYSSNNETLLGWKLRKPLPNLMNYTSSKFNLFNRETINSAKTKDNIIKETKNIFEEFNPTHKQKGITEFIELSRVSGPNINNDYNKAIKGNPDIFKKKNNFSSEFYNIYYKYNNICDKPFQKFNIL